MPLIKREALVRDYRAAIQAYQDACRSFDTDTFHDALHRTESARRHVEEARSALLKHEHLHVDTIGPRIEDSSANGPQIIGSTVSLFNVATEHWDLFELSQCGVPPSGALAYAPQPGHDPGTWITNTHELISREVSNEKLYFTGTGLAILRERGLEM